MIKKQQQQSSLIAWEDNKKEVNALESTSNLLERERILRAHPQSCLMDPIRSVCLFLFLQDIIWILQKPLDKCFLAAIKLI